MFLGLLLACLATGTRADDEGKGGCRPGAFQFQNYRDVNVDSLMYYNFNTTIPAVNTTDPLNNNLTTWTWSRVQDLTLGPYGTIKGHWYPGVNVGSPFGMFNGSSLIGANGVPAAIWSSGLPIDVPSAASSCALNFEALVNFKNIWATNIQSCAGRASDPFYGAGIVSAIDTASWFQFGFLLTNHKIYGLYSRWLNGWTTFNDYYSFIYMVPIGDRRIEDWNRVGLLFNRRSRSVDYFVDNSRRMTIRMPGTAIDDKFLTNNFGGTPAVEPFPSSFTFEIGVYTPTVANLVKGACQGMFSPCANSAQGQQPITDAWATVCRYVAPQSQSTFNSTLILNMREVAVNQVCQMETPCPCYAPRPGQPI